MNDELSLRIRKPDCLRKAYRLAATVREDLDAGLDGCITPHGVDVESPFRATHGRKRPGDAILRTAADDDRCACSGGGSVTEALRALRADRRPPIIAPLASDGARDAHVPRGSDHADAPVSFRTSSCSARCTTSFFVRAPVTARASSISSSSSTMFVLMAWDAKVRPLSRIPQPGTTSRTSSRDWCSRTAGTAASMIALKVALGRIALEAFSASGR